MRRVRVCSCVCACCHPGERTGLTNSLEVLCALLLFTKFKFTAAIFLFGLMSLVLVTHVSFHLGFETEDTFLWCWGCWTKLLNARELRAPATPILGLRTLFCDS